MSIQGNIVNAIIENLSSFDSEQLSQIKQAIHLVLNEYSIQKKTEEIAVLHDDVKSRAIQMYFVSKKVEGCTDNTLNYYKTILNQFFNKITHPLNEICSDDIRFYIATRAMKDNVSKTTQDNELRVLKSFFNWCGAEGYINSIPTLNVKPIRQEKRIKKPFSEIEIELLRQGTDNLRDLAIIDVLYSTGVRISELCNIAKTDIENDEIIVFGKGEKERVVYLNAKAQLSLKKYFNSRTDRTPFAFVQLKNPYTQLSKSAVETMLRKLGEKTGIKNVHPHRFRRTSATLALNRGMPIEQVSQLLGHEKIETTTIYARSDKENVKASHKKYVV